MCDEDYDPDPDQPSDHPDAPVPPFEDDEEDEYEKIESRLLTAVGQFESEWDKAWHKWLGTHNIPEDEAADMLCSPYDEEGYTLPEAEAWFAIYDCTKTNVEKEFGCEITVDTDGTVFAIHHLPDGDTITVP